MKKTYFILMAFAALTITSLTGCKEDDLRSESVFANGMGSNKSEYTIFDEWLLKNFVQDYNIDFRYFYSDKEADQSYNVVPADYDKAKALAYLVKYVWLDSYTEAMKGNKDFMRTYSPRVIQLTGSYKWNSNNSQVLGTAEQGMKVMLYGVNELDLDNIRFVADNPYEAHDTKPLDLNYWFFHTMHHEFCHILTQKKEYNPDFKVISAGKFHATDWINVKDKQAATEGFVTGYASGEYNEDFAETYAMYISYSADGWEKIMKQAGDAAPTIQQKVDLVREYFQTAWGINIDEMRNIVQRRCQEVTQMDLRNIDFSK